MFGFGILLLELVTGQRALELGKASGALHSHKGVVMLDWVRTPMRNKAFEIYICRLGKIHFNMHYYLFLFKK